MNQPRRFLFTAWPFPGHLFPLIALAGQLRDLGHECAFYTGSRGAAVVEREGFTCFRFEHVDEAAIDELMRNRPAEPWRAASLPKLGRLLQQWLLDTVRDQVADLEPICAAWKPDVIGTDPTLWGPVLVLHDKLKIPVAVCSFIPACPLPGPDAPPFGPGFARHPGAAGSILSTLVRVTTRMSARVSRKTVNVVRASHGLPPITVSPTEYTGTMPVYLIPASRQFDYDRHDLPSTIHYVGPYLWNRPRTQPPTPWLSEIRRDVPCVHVTEGTVHVQQPFVLKAALAGLGGLAMTVIATTGGDREIGELGIGAIPQNARIEPWVSHADLLPLTDVMVTTGGAGSVLASLAAGVPLVIVPTEWDKPEIAQRVVESGAGIRIAPQRCTPDRLRESVQRVLRDGSFREAARRLAVQFQDLAGSGRATELLVALAGSPRRTDH